jgi:hypothetical protein
MERPEQKKEAVDALNQKRVKSSDLTLFSCNYSVLVCHTAKDIELRTNIFLFKSNVQTLLLGKATYRSCIYTKILIRKTNGIFLIDMLTI